jgi:histidinol-phosphate aminotransferase
MSIDKYIRRQVRELPSYHLEAIDGIKLNQNESPFDIPVEVKALIIEKLMQTPWNRYPVDDLIKLKKKAANYLNVWPDSLSFANGSNVLIQALIQATSINGKVLVLDPTFSVYELQGKMLGNQIIRVPLNEDFTLPQKNLLNTISKEKPNIIFIANPNAPTGNLFSENDLREIIESSSSIVVIDEAYYPFSGSSVVDWVKDYQNLVVLRTFSKAFSLGGLRLGYMISDPEIAYEVQKCLLPFCINKLTFIVADTILDHPDYIQKYVDQINLERDRVFKEMKKISAIEVFPTKANFILFRVKDANLIFKKLVDQNIIIRQVDDGRALSNCLRVSIGTPDENDAFLDALEEVL